MGNLFCCVQVDQSTVAIKERFGRFQEVLEPGCHCLPWILGNQLAGHLSLRLQQLDVRCETKTKDNVFVNVVASVQYRAIAEKANDAFYKLSNTRTQIQAYVFDVIRASVPKLNLDDAFEQKNDIAKAVEDELEKAMSAYGYEIVQTLIVDIEPDEHVKRAMNEINAAARLRVAANEKAEAEKILQIKRAEGDGTSTAEEPNFLTQLSQDNWPSVLFAMAGGVVLSLGNLATQYSLAFVGLSVTEVITASITVVIGTTINYFLDEKINNAAILFPGVGCFLIAVCLGSAVHTSNVADNKAKLSIISNGDKTQSGATDVLVSKETHPIIVETEDPENGSSTAEKAKFGSADFLIELENRRAIQVFGKSTMIGLGITFFAGICFSLFSPAFNLATNDQWHTLKDGVAHLTVYTAFFYFSVSCFVIAIVLNINFLYHPVLNLPRSSLRAYLTDWNGRGWAFLAGLLCGFGNGLQFVGGQAAGYAAADAVQALPLVSTFWGILLFGEYRKSSRRTYILLASMLFMFIVAVAVLMASAGSRE